MTKKDKQILADKIEWEGGDYTLFEYSDWKEIKDKKFHQLRKEIVRLRKELYEYIEIDK